ncbi:MAG: 2OG-Fe(II) oxygenase [Alphaproteobacteria bacterium]|nr:2OG-Fe(II) oxygenase [Alphaproteobacteria bacterium]
MTAGDFSLPPVAGEPAMPEVARPASGADQPHRRPSALGETFRDPVPHSAPYRFVMARADDLDRLRRLRRRLQRCREWVHCRQPFFEHWEADLSTCAIDEAGPLLPEACLASVAKAAERWFGQPLSSRVKLLAHRMEAGHHSELHNDNPRFGHETHRLNLYLNDDWHDGVGGRLRVAASNEPHTDDIAIRPTIGTVMVFEASPHSFHGVDRVAGGQRYSILFYLWHAGNTPEVRTAVADSLARAAPARERVCSRAAGLIELLRSAGAGEVGFGASTLLEQAVRSAALLASWGAPEPAWLAALLQLVDDEVLADAGSALPGADIDAGTLAAAAAIALSLGQASPAGGDPRLAAAAAGLRFSNIVAGLPALDFSHAAWLAHRGAFVRDRAALPSPARSLGAALFDHPLPATELPGEAGVG